MPDPPLILAHTVSRTINNFSACFIRFYIETVGFSIREEPFFLRVHFLHSVLLKRFLRWEYTPEWEWDARPPSSRKSKSPIHLLECLGRFEETGELEGNSHDHVEQDKFHTDTEQD